MKNKLFVLFLTISFSMTATPPSSDNEPILDSWSKYGHTPGQADYLTPEEALKYIKVTHYAQCRALLEMQGQLELQTHSDANSTDPLLLKEPLKQEITKHLCLESFPALAQTIKINTAAYVAYLKHTAYLEKFKAYVTQLEQKCEGEEIQALQDLAQQAGVSLEEIKHRVCFIVNKTAYDINRNNVHPTEPTDIPETYDFSNLNLKN